MNESDILHPTHAADHGLPQYFDLQARLGHTKHLGGAAATHRLGELCQLGSEKSLLYVGSGGGNSALYIAQKYNCRVVGVDLLPEMVASARKWAIQKGLTDQTEFRVGDAQDLPFQDDQFDAVMCESVNVFVPDKAKAISEYVRVVKPGGIVGLNEAIWIKEPSPKVAAIIVEATGQEFQPPEVWETLMAESGLTERVSEQHAMSMRTEARNQTGLLNTWEYLKILVEAIKLIFTDRETRALLKYMGSNPTQYFEYMGYGIYAGRKPA